MKIQLYIKGKRDKDSYLNKLNELNDSNNIQINSFEFVRGYIVSLKTNNTNEKSTKELSKLYRDSKLDNLQITIIEDEVSEYFCKMLYPHIAKFERTLRKYLILRCYKNGRKEAIKQVSSLDTKDLGYIQKLLFSDIKFVNEVTKYIKEPGVSKEKLIDYIN